MSYARWSADSSVYLFGTTTADGEHVIECCGCILASDWRKARTDAERAQVADICAPWSPVPPVDMEWDWSPVQHFRTNAAALAHLREHLVAGHKVPAYAISGIERDDWLPAVPEDAERAIRAQLEAER